MSSAASWINELRNTATDVGILLNKIDALRLTAERNATAYNLRELGSDPSDTIGQKVRHWLELEGPTGDFPQPTSNDLWAAALVLNKLNESLTEDDKTDVTWIAQ